MYIEIHIPDNGRDFSTSPTVVWTSPSVEIRCVCTVVDSFTGEGESHHLSKIIKIWIN